MNDAVFAGGRRAISLPEGLVVFGFFAWGAMIAAFTTASLPQLLPERSLLSLLLLSLPLLGSSGFGWLLLPLEMLGFGLYSESAVLRWLQHGGEDGLLQLMPLAFRFFLTPVVLLACMYALGASGAVCAAVQRASPSARGEYQRRLCLTIFFTLLGLAGVFYFI